MSFVNTVQTDQFISIISDGKITDPENKMNGDIKKFVKHPNNFFVAVTGYLDIWASIRKQIISNPFLDVEKAKDLVINSLEFFKNIRSTDGSIASASAIIAGFRNNRFYGFSIRMKEGHLIVNEMESSGTTSLDPELDFDTAPEIAAELVNLGESLTIDKIQSCQRKELMRVANVSPSVNKTVFQEVIYNR